MLVEPRSIDPLDNLYNEAHAGQEGIDKNWTIAQLDSSRVILIWAMV